MGMAVVGKGTHVCGHMCVCACMHVEAQGWCWESFVIFLPSYSLRHCLLIKPIAILCGKSQKSACSGIPLFLPSKARFTSRSLYPQDVYMVLSTNYSPHACLAEASPSKPDHFWWKNWNKSLSKTLRYAFAHSQYGREAVNPTVRGVSVGLTLISVFSPFRRTEQITFHLSVVSCAEEGMFGDVGLDVRLDDEWSCSGWERPFTCDSTVVSTQHLISFPSPAHRGAPPVKPFLVLSATISLHVIWEDIWLISDQTGHL